VIPPVPLVEGRAEAPVGDNDKAVAEYPAVPPAGNARVGVAEGGNARGASRHRVLFGPYINNNAPKFPMIPK
jgi:hypothetical protein